MYLQLVPLFTLVFCFAVADHPSHRYRVCVGNVAACSNASLSINVTCQGATSGSSCVKDVVDGRADMTLASADDMVKYAYNLQIVYGQNISGVDENFIQYYGLAVVKKNTTFNFTSLRNQKSCHTGVGKTVGWKIPVGRMIYNKIMTYTESQYKSASEFFGESCAPGIKDISGVSEAVKTDLCSLCNGTCAKNSTEPYYNYMGAFKCMADGNNDRVGFVKETTAAEFLNKSLNYGVLGDYKLLCPNGATAALNRYKTCNLGTRPAYAIVTGKSTSPDGIMHIQSMLEGADFSKLKTAGIVSDKAESLAKYSSTSVKEYVGSYGNYYNGLYGSTKGFYKVCVSDVSACGNASFPNVTCVAARYGSSCVKDVIDGRAHVTLATADSMVQNADNLQIVYGQKINGVYENFTQYYGLAVVKKNTTFNFNSLRNQKSCHTGVGKTVGWKIPVGSMIFTKMMPYTLNQYRSASDFFGQSCAPGIKDISGVSDAVKTDLCSLCNGTCAKNSTEPYYDYMGAFKCMADGNNDRIGFVKQTTARDFLNKYSNYGVLGDYKLLCPDGTTADLNKYKNCYIGTRPAHAIVTGKSTSSAMITQLQTMLESAELNKLRAAGIVHKYIERLVRYTGGSVKDYVGSYGNYYNGLSGRTAFFTACVNDVSACRKAGLENVTCVEATSGSTCAKDVTEGRAHMTLASADSMVQNAANLQIVYGQNISGVDRNFIQYYGLAVVEKNTTFNFKSLESQKSCHTGVGKTVGWKIPIGYMLFNKIMTYTDNQYKSASDFFGQSCAPGIKAIPDVSEAVKTDLCSLCSGTCAKGSSEPYYGYMGAFKCMADGNNDRVGFVKETTASDFLKKYSNYGVLGDYNLLCPNGTKAALTEFENCNIGTRPALAIVTGKSTTSTTITQIQSMLEGADLNKLKAAGIVSKDAESLAKYTGGSVENYVGSYRNYYNSLTQKANAAPSLMLSFALQITAMLVFWLVA